LLDYLRRLATTGVAYTAASVLSKILAVALLPLYTHYVDPEGYGVAELLFTSVVTASIVIRFGLIESLLRFFYLPDEDPDEVVRTGFGALFWLATVASLIALPFAPGIANLLNIEGRPTSSGSRSAGSGCSRSTSTWSRSTGSTSARRRTSRSRSRTRSPRSR
jgi:O-antigen/teichoic acid export membrane protein